MQTKDLIVPISAFSFMTLIFWMVMLVAKTTEYVKLARAYPEVYCSHTLIRFDYVFPVRPLSCWLAQPVGKND